MIIDRFEPIGLRVERIGPFDEIYHLDFMKRIDVNTEDSRPSRLFLLASQNAKGKTTLLEAFALAINMLRGPKASFSIQEDILNRGGRIQLDIRVTATLDNSNHVSFILSLIQGEMIYDYLPDELDELSTTDGQAAIISNPDFVRLMPKDDLANEFLWAVERGDDWSFKGLFNEEFNLPTVLFFTDDRGMSRPPSGQIVIAKPQNLNYQPCHIFSHEEGDWRNSIDNLLCWLTWLSEDGAYSDKSHFNKACNTVNELVIDDSDKRLKLLKRDPPEPYIEAGGKYHRLDRLSSGELSRLQIILRTASLMTSNTILIIDELELHLHPISQHHLLDELINLIKQYPGLRLYFTTHSKELVERGINLGTRFDDNLLAAHRIIEQS